MKTLPEEHFDGSRFKSIQFINLKQHAMYNILLISGTRPEIIKLAPLYHALREASWANVQWLHTGQHTDMASQILACFNVVPDMTLQRIGSSLLDFSMGCRQQLEREMAQKTLGIGGCSR
jgi:UDP-N-acetylglucosamine 2-epimerase (non-hydrolysing)